MASVEALWLRFSSTPTSASIPSDLSSAILTHGFVERNICHYLVRDRDLEHLLWGLHTKFELECQSSS